MRWNLPEVLFQATDPPRDESAVRKDNLPDLPNAVFASNGKRTGAKNRSGGSAEGFVEVPLFFDRCCSVDLGVVQVGNMPIVIQHVQSAAHMPVGGTVVMTTESRFSILKPAGVGAVAIIQKVFSSIHEMKMTGSVFQPLYFEAENTASGVYVCSGNRTVMKCRCSVPLDDRASRDRFPVLRIAGKGIVPKPACSHISFA